MSAKLELTISPDYVNWGVWACLREFLQNAKDGDTMGYPMTVRYKRRANAPDGIVIKNDGFSLTKDTLVLGTSSKRGSEDQIGQFGEGYKLACARLVSSGYDVWIRTGKEIWVPKIEFSTKFGTDLLVFHIKKAQTYADGLTIEVRGVCEEDYEMVKERLLFLTPPSDSIDVGSKGRILRDGAHTNMLFSKGIYVGHLPAPHVYGYDIPVELDRDRKMADPWSLKSAIRTALLKATSDGQFTVQQIMQVLNSHPESGEAAAFSSEDIYSQYENKNFHKECAQAFISEYGDDAVPVASIGEAIEAEHHGFNGIVVSKAIKSIIEVHEGTFESRKIDRAFSVNKIYSVEDLSEGQLENLVAACSMVSSVTGEFNGLLDVCVVDFVGGSIQGTFTDGAIKLASKILDSRWRLISVLVHEVAHHHGGDGTVEHRNAIDKIFGEIIAENWDAM